MNTTTAGTSPTATVACPFCHKLNRIDLGKADAGPKCGECGKPVLLDRPLKLTDDDFDKVIGGTTVPVIVDFYADWCGPCRIMVPVFDELAAAWMGRALIAKVDTDREQEVSNRFGIRGIPTFIVFKDGREVARQSGAVPKPVVEQLFSRFV